MREAICWIGYNRPEYAQVSLESIFNSLERPDDFYAFVDNDGTDRSKNVVDILESYGVKNITFREYNYEFTPHILGAMQDFFNEGYDVCHYIEDDIIISKDFFIRSRVALSKPEISMFCGCVVIEEQMNKIYPYFSTWGTSIKRSVFDAISPHVDSFLRAWKNGTTMEYQREHFGHASVKGFDGLIDRIVVANNLLAEYPERSYSKDIGEYGIHREEGIPPLRTLEEWAEIIPKGEFGFGINGLNFKL